MKIAYWSISFLLIAGIYLTIPNFEQNSPANYPNSQKSLIMQEDTLPQNSEALVNYSYFKQLVDEVEEHRSSHLVSLDKFLDMSENRNTVILDTRSKAMYDLKHVKGAVHLNFSDFTLPELEKIFNQYQGTNTQILIYCNNNFYDSEAIPFLTEEEFVFQDMAFVSKSTLPVELTIVEEEITFNNEYSLALNIPTYINLFGYGYKNVFELNELVDVHDSRISFEGTFDDKDESKGY